MSYIVDAMERLRSLLLSSDDAARQEMARRWLQVEQSINSSVQALAEQIARNGETPTIYQISRMRRYRVATNDIITQLDRYRAWSEEYITDRQRNAVQLALSTYDDLISAGMADEGVIARFGRVPVTAVENLVGSASDGSPLRSILVEASSQGPEGFTRQLVTGLATGKSPYVVAREAVRLGLGQSFTRFATIARTETLRAYRQATLEGYRASEVVTSYRRVASKSIRTCIACLALDGQIFPLNREFEQHPNCRCTLSPVLTSRPSPGVETGREWFERQDSRTQRSILGPGVFDLWQHRLVGWDDLYEIHENPTWGDTPQSRSLRDIRLRVRG